MLDRSTQAQDQRRFLFLQGLPSPLFYKLGRALEQSGHLVRRINLCAGDMLFWPRPGADHYRGRFSKWADFLLRYLERHRITDILMFGDRRPYHRVAARLAGRLGIQVHSFDEGYLRPDWITMESDPSWLPQLIAADLPELARRLDSPANHRRVGGGFARLACWNIAFQALTTVLWPLFPFYRRHRPQHPVVEGLGWVRRSAQRQQLERSARCAQQKLVTAKTPFFLLPLQLDSDYQIRDRSPFRHMGEVMELVMASFARHAPGDDALVIKVHPLDNGLVDRQRQVRDLSVQHGLKGRVHFLDGGHLPTLIGASKGVVVVNSTTGLTALHQRKPTFALADAVYKLPGLVSPGTLEEFWTYPAPPRQELVAAFEKVLADHCQVNGSFFTPAGIDLAVQNILLRLQKAPSPDRCTTPREFKRGPAGV